MDSSSLRICTRMSDGCSNRSRTASSHAARSPAVLASAEVLKELVKRVLEIKDGKMAVYAMIVEESVRRSMVGGSRGDVR